MIKRSFLGVAFAVAFAGAAGIRAGTTINLKGSDTLFDFTNALMASCPGTALPYAGTGSGNGQSAMLAGTQQVAPMSRFLNSGACTGTAAALTQSEGLVIGLDGLSIVGSTTTTASVTCNGHPNTTCDPTFEPTTGAAFNTKVVPTPTIACTTNADCPTATAEVCTCPGGAAQPCSPALSGTCGYTFNGWRDILRVLFAGMIHSGPATGTNAAAVQARDCGSRVRRAIANNYGAFFENNCAAPAGDSTGGNCTQIRHVFRRDDFSGTTDTVVSLLGLPAIVQPETQVTLNTNGTATSITNHTGFTPFCNAVRPAFAYPQQVTPTVITQPTCLQGSSQQAAVPSSDAPYDPSSKNLGTGFTVTACNPPNVVNNGICFTATCPTVCPLGQICSAAAGGICVPLSTFDPTCVPPRCCPTENSVYRATMQDNDPIRRTCAGSGGGTAPAEDVCSHSGDLGLVLTMNDALEPAPRTNADRYNPNLCVRKFASVTAPDVYDAITQAKQICTRGLLCPNGDFCNNLGGCLAPTDNNLNTQCLGSKLTAPPTPISGLGVPVANPRVPGVAEGRAYNQHLYLQVGSAGSYQTNGFTTLLPMTGAYYRIHTAHSLNPATNRTCQFADATDQIGCLVEASPCSIGFAGRGAVSPTANPNSGAIKLANQSPETACIQSSFFIYPMARKLYLNSVPGFANVTGQELQLAGCMTDLAQPSHNPPTPAGLVTTNIVAAGFLTIPAFMNNGLPYCEDFNEEILCGAALNNIACEDLKPNFDDFPQFSTICGDGLIDAFEDCDNGLLNGPPPASCSAICRSNN